MIEEIKNTLNTNQNITPEVKAEIIKLTEIFNKKFPEINLANLNERLKTLIIKRESMYLVKLPCQYNPFNNEILVNLGRMEENDLLYDRVLSSLHSSDAPLCVVLFL